MRRLLAALALCTGVFSARAETVLVLPFFNLSKSPSLDWIGESMAESVRESLAAEGVLVLERDDRLEAFRRLSIRPNAVLTEASVIKVGEALDAGKVIYGHYDVSPAEGAGAVSRASLRLAARILDLKRMRQGAEFAEIGALEELATLETHLSWQALEALALKSGPSEKEFLQARPPVRVDAIESYIRGLMTSNLEQKHRYFTQAARLDERYSQPCFQLGKIYWDKKEYGVAAGWLERVKPADSHYLEARFFLGLCRYQTGEFQTAVKAFESVAASVPLNEVYNDLGAAQLRLGAPGAIESFRKALEGDSSDPDYYFNLGYAQWKAKRFDQAADSFRAALDRNPNDAEAVSFLGRSLKKEVARPGDSRSEGRERLKTSYEETAYRQLKAELSK